MQKQNQQQDDKVVLFQQGWPQKNRTKTIFFDTWEIICSYRNKYIELMVRSAANILGQAYTVSGEMTHE